MKPLKENFFKTPYTILSLLMLSLPCFSQQETRALTLDQVLERAQTHSLIALRANNQYLAGYWQFRSYKASLLPHIGLDLTPVDYNRSFIQRYDPENDVDVFREQQTYYANSSVYISQNLGFSGGTLSLSTGLSHLENLNSPEFSAYNASPVQLTYHQPLLGFNEFKWQKRLQPLQYQLARQQFIENSQQIHLEAIARYFEVLLAHTQKEIALHNRSTSDTLYQIGKKRFALAAIPKEELLNLELNKFKADIALAQAEKHIQRAQFNLNSFLSYDENTAIQPELPKGAFPQQIAVDQAIARAIQHNPEMIGLQEKNLQASRNLDKARKESRLNANLMASFGLNNSATEMNQAYQDLANRQQVRVGMQIPLADWGQRKGQRLMAEKQKEVATLEIQQTRLDFEQKVALKVIDFNLQHKLVNSALQAADIAEQAYELTKKRFVLGKTDVLQLNSASQTRQDAQEGFIRAVYTLWQLYYEVQQLTLYDFRKEQPLSIDFKQMVR
ncbi:TolC family protein [Rapidithrix thailandica]|uniref:TolC family protein n=1 Tax=Rapidithrix thailandica TaxID=413964 RepID=A0AAW9RY45_9BACT